MRPHHLHIEALGPYAGEIDVPFDELVEEGLFLIHGDTGAGKTFLLDALCFALYGDVPGDRGSDSLYSDHADHTRRPQACLEFTAQEQRWRITREPKHSVPKKDGTLTSRPAKVHLERLDGTTWSSITNKATEADDLITEKIGLNADQFQQVILLPQGQFQKVLRAQSKDREKLLRTLFDTNLYERATYWIDDQHKARVGKVLDAERGLAALRAKTAERWQSLVAEHVADASPPEGPVLIGSESDDGNAADLPWPADQADLDTLVERLTTMVEEAEAELRSTATEAERCRQAADQASEVAKRWDRRSELRRQRAKLEAAQEAVDADARVHGTAVAAEPLRTLLDDEVEQRARLVELTEAIGASSDAHDRAAREAPSLPKDTRPPTSEGAPTSEDLSAWRDALAKHRSVLDAHVKDADTVETLLKAAKVDRQTESDQREAERNATAKVTDCQKRTKTLEGELAEAEAAAQQLTLLTKAAEEARARADAAAALAKLHPRVDQAERAVQGALEAHNDADRKELDLRRRYLDGIAAVLAGQLEDASPCPVCGSEEHPQPARPAADAVALDDVDKAEATTRAAKAKLDTARTDLANIQADASALEGAAGDTAANPEAAIEAADNAESDLAAATRRAGRTTDLRREQTTLTKEAEAAAQAESEARTAATAAASQATAREEQATTLQAAIHEALGEVAPRDARNALDRVDERAKDLAAAIALAESAQTAHASTVSSLQKAVDGSPFADRDQAAAALRDDDVRAELLARIEEHREQVRSVTQDLAADELTDLPEDRPDPAPAQEAALVADAVATTARERRTLVVDAHKAISSWASEHRTGLDELGSLRDEAAVWREVARRCLGQLDPKVSLQRWVLSAYLEEICEFANQRLTTMTGGRYSLSVYTEKEKGGAQSGLGLRVHDTYTGQERQVTTLSGGETFQASLALALGVADVVAKQTGGVRLETLFVDEGFGTLDPEALQLAMDELDRLREGGRAVGLISHVGGLRERIRTGIEVTSSERGSTVRVGAVAQV